MNEEKTGIIKNNKELDTTILTIAGNILVAIAILGLYVLHFLNPEKTLLSPKIIIAMSLQIQIITILHYEYSIAQDVHELLGEIEE